MTRAMRAAPEGAGPRCLRVGVVRGGRIEEERTIRSRDTVTVGAAERATLVMPHAGLGSRHPLFERRGDRYVLRVPAGVRGRVATAGGTVSLDGSAREVVLDDHARGKVELGDASLLFQMVVPPPETPRPRLPAAVRGGFLAGIDWFFSAAVTTSFMLFFGFVLVLEGSDWPVAQAIDAVPEQAARFIVEEPEPPPPDPVDARTTEPEDAVEETPEDAAETSDDAVADARPDPRPSPRPPSDPDAQPSLQDPDEIRQAALLTLGTLFDGGEETSALDRLREGAPTTDAAEVLASVDATSPVADASRLHERPGRGSTPTSDDLGRLARAGTPSGPVDEGGPLTETHVPDFDVGMDGWYDDGGTGVFDPAVVTAAVRRRMGAMRACYEHALGPNPDLSGKVTVRFTIHEAGNVSGVTAVENTTGSRSLARCVMRSFGTLRFNPGPEGGDVSFRYPMVFASQQR